VQHIVVRVRRRQKILGKDLAANSLQSALPLSRRSCGGNASKTKTHERLSGTEDQSPRRLRTLLRVYIAYMGALTPLDSTSPLPCGLRYPAQNAILCVLEEWRMRKSVSSTFGEYGNTRR